MRKYHFTTNLRGFLLEHLAEELDAASIARHLGISRSKLYLTCEKYLGTGIAGYVRSLRVEKAKELLRETNKSLAEIANAVGFQDYNYFCKIFKRLTGTSPGKYRRQ